MSSLLLKHLPILAVCEGACVREIYLNRRCLGNAFGFTEISDFPVLLDILPISPGGRAEGIKGSPTSLGVILKGFLLV